MTTLSIIIPTRNRAGRLRSCLDSLARQTADPNDFEVIVVDDGSTDETLELVAKLETPYSLRVLEQSRAGQAAARNRALATAGGACCLFLDDDVVPAPELVAGHLRAQGRRGGIVGIGKLEWRAAEDAPWLERAHLAALTRYFGRLETGERAPRWIDCYSGNLSAPTHAVRAAGGFDGTLAISHDAQLGFRLAEAGLPIEYLPDALGIHDGPKSTRALISDFEREGVDAVLLWRWDRRTMPVVLGAFENSTPRAISARRLLLAASLPARTVYVLCLALRRVYSDELAYRFFNDYCLWLGVKRTLRDRRSWRRLTRGIPVLVYHGFCESNPERSRYVVSRRRLRWQLRWLKAMRYRVVPLEELVDCLASCEPPPPKAAAITIDDAYESSFTVALPLLRRFGFPATYFAVSRRLGETNTWDRAGELAGSPVMTLEQLQRIAMSGMSVGAHTRTHADVTRLDGELVAEVAGSRTDLERALGRPVRLFAFPWGRYDARAVAAVAAAGYAGSCTTIAERNSLHASPFEVARIEIKGGDSLRAFASKVAGRRGRRSGGRARAAARERRLRRWTRPRLLYLLRKRREPLSEHYGRERGQPVDRYYIRAFLQRRRGDIRGVCLELRDARYTQAFGTDVTRSEVLDIDRTNKDATIVGDLRHLDGVPDETFDCLVLTQVLQYMDEPAAAVRECYRILRPGGVLLATLPSLGRIDRNAGVEGDYWRFTRASAEFLFTSVFAPESVEVEAHGNVLVGLAFWIGMAREELSREELDHHDPDFPCLITVRAVK